MEKLELESGYWTASYVFFCANMYGKSVRKLEIKYWDALCRTFLEAHVRRPAIRTSMVILLNDYM